MNEDLSFEYFCSIKLSPYILIYNGVNFNILARSNPEGTGRTRGFATLTNTFINFDNILGFNKASKQLILALVAQW